MSLTLNLNLNLPNFTEYVIKLLKTQNLTTVIDFMKTDSIKLSKITNLELREIQVTKEAILRRYGPINECNFNSNYLYVSTGIENLDNLLGGGFMSGQLYDICGISGAGKTQICSTIAVNLATQKQETLYMDAKNDFSGIRIHKMLQDRNYSADMCGMIMKRIHCLRLCDVNNFLNVLSDLEADLANYKQIKCLVVDSLPALWFPFSDIKSEGTPLLCKATNLMKQIAFNHQLFILLVNIATRWTEYDKGLEYQQPANKTETTVALGKYWQTVPFQRLLMSRIDYTENESQNTCERFIKIIKGNHKGKSCIVNITSKGVI